jgi:transketolase
MSNIELINKLVNISNYGRYLIIKTLIDSGLGHPGGSLSAIDMLTALYFEVMEIDASDPNSPDRDRFILSKGHSSIGMCSILCMKGFISEEELKTFRKNDSRLWGHMDVKTPGVEMSTGSLGHGFAVGAGKALAAKIDNKSYKTYVMMGDGETQEGSIWETAMAATNYKLDNLVGIVDRNKIQQCGFTEDVMALEPYKDKWEAFGWRVIEIDGHDMEQILKALNTPPSKNQPTLILSNTVKGKGISFMENDNNWHGGGAIGKYSEAAMQEVIEFAKYKELLNE